MAPRHTPPMNLLASFSTLITTAQSLASAVTVRDNVHLRNSNGRKAVAMRLVSGLRILRAFLRRLVILIALELEWGLIEERGPLKRPHKRKLKPKSAKLSLTCFDPDEVSPWLNNIGPTFKPRVKSQNEEGTNPPAYVDMAALYAQLDFLTGIAANPLAKAKRLAFHLARRSPGLIMAPAGPWRIPGRWGTDVSATFDAMAGSIITQSRNRPPPLPPRRWRGPSITVL